MIERSMKRDGRTFAHQTLETIPMMAIERVREGERPANVIASYGFNQTTIYKWLKASSEAGDEALRSTPATGRTPPAWLYRHRSVTARSNSVPSTGKRGGKPTEGHAPP